MFSALILEEHVSHTYILCSLSNVNAPARKVGPGFLNSNITRRLLVKENPLATAYIAHVYSASTPTKKAFDHSSPYSDIED